MKRTLNVISIILGLAIFFQRCNQGDPELPEVSTAEATAIAVTDALSGGEVIGDGGATVISRGVCWSASTNPTIENDTTENGLGTGAFISQLTGLTAGTTYFVRAYAINKVGVAYGDEIEFTTLPVPTIPEVTTVDVSSITYNSASAGGNVMADGGESVTDRGVCWNTASGPTIAGNKTTNGIGTGEFVSAIANLSAATTYYVRAYATNSVGTAYGNEISFTTNSVTITLYSIKDGVIFNNQAGTSPNGNYGAGGDQLLQVGYAAPTAIYARSLVQFDLSSIPATAVIESVQLEFKLSSSGTFVPVIYLHKMEQVWTEGNTASACVAGSACNIQGVAITTGNDATWNETSYSGSNANPWTTAGATFNLTPSAVSTDGGASTILYLSDQMKNDVQSWVSNSAGNFGWLLRTDFITNTSAMRRFYSREGTVASGSPADAPRLVVSYH